MQRKFLAQNLRERPQWQVTLVHYRTLRHLSPGRTSLSLFVSLVKAWDALLLNPPDRPEASLNFSTKPAVTRQATRWRSGVRQVRAEAAAGALR